jgi:hypothetical protein
MPMDGLGSVCLLVFTDAFCVLKYSLHCSLCSAYSRSLLSVLRHGLLQFHQENDIRSRSFLFANVNLWQPKYIVLTVNRVITNRISKVLLWQVAFLAMLSCLWGCVTSPLEPFSCAKLCNGLQSCSPSSLSVSLSLLHVSKKMGRSIKEAIHILVVSNGKLLKH